MSLHVLDTDVLSQYARGVEPLRSRIDAHPREELATTVITVEEQMAGWYSLVRQARHPPDLALAYRRLGEAVHFLARWAILEYTETAMAQVATWQKLRLNVGKSDLRIAAIAGENSAVVVTRNLRDFGRIPGVTAVDWSN